MAEAADDNATPKETESRVEGLILQLGDDDFERREAAQAALARMGPSAVAALTRAKEHEDFEIACRARYLLDRIRIAWTRPNDLPLVKELFARYDYLSDAEKVIRIQLMQSQPAEIRAITLGRVTRNEPNPNLSKLAALGLLGVQPLRIATASGLDLAQSMMLDEERFFGNARIPNVAGIQIQGGMFFPGNPMLEFELDPTELMDPLNSMNASGGENPAAESFDPAVYRDSIERELGDCDRPGAGWVRAVSRFEAERDVGAFLSQWRGFREAEASPEGGGDARDGQLQKAIADQLLWYEANVLFREGRKEEGLVAAKELMETAAIGSAELELLVEWFTKSDESALLEQLSTERAEEFSRNPLLLYQIAEGFRKAGDETRAESVARRAAMLNRGGSPMDILKHQQVASILWERGSISWAERELQAILDMAQPGSTFALRAQYHLSRLQFEDERPMDAAKGLEKLLDAERAKGELNPTLAQYQIQCDYYYSQHYRRIGEREKEREYLEKVLAANMIDSETMIDVLIAAWQAEGLSERTRRNLKTRIETMLARDFRVLAARPDDPTAYNNYAWLAANTKLGDLKQALEFSKKSIEIAGENYAYLDTLAHCYHALGDFENAVKYQEKAAALAPHAKVITSKLDFFLEERDAAREKESP